MAQRHHEFLERGARVFAISADTPPMNAAVVRKLGLRFPILSDPDRDRAITPLGFADEEDPRQISRPGAMMISTDGETAYTMIGRDYAHRPVEDLLLQRVEALGLPPTSQEPPELGEVEPGEKAVPFEGLAHYFRGAKFTALALRRRHRDLGDDFAEDTKAYLEMVERYLDALTGVEERRE